MTDGLNATSLFLSMSNFALLGACRQLFYKSIPKPMTRNSIVERFGGITKEEPVKSLPKDLVWNNTQVYEGINPFFGYYNDGPQVKNTHYLLLVLDGHHPFEVLARASDKLQKMVDFSFNATPASISFRQRTWQAIRVKNIKDYSHAIKLQELYNGEGVQFKSLSEVVAKEMAMIRLLKFFCLEQHPDGIYLDTLNPNVGYFNVPNYINWEDFKVLTKKVKYETSILFFDAATGFLAQTSKLGDFIRIYKEQMSYDRIVPIRDRYLKLWD